MSMEGSPRSNETMIPNVINRLAIMFPSGNTTAVVFDDILGAPREELNDRLMSEWQSKNPDKPEIEQCCFVTEPEDSRAIARVQMFGGEFCGNATRSVIQLLLGGRDQDGLIEVSGASNLLAFSVRGKEITVEMPLPEEKERIVESVDEGTLVHLDGISHLVVTDAAQKEKLTGRQLLEKLLEENKYGVRQLPAFGVTYYYPETTEANFAVWVNEVNTIFDETACGSGTCSIGVATANMSGTSVKLDVLQPSGQTIVTESDLRDGQVSTSRISGIVDVVYDGQFNLS